MNRKGSAVLEMALILPILLTLLFGIIEFSRVLSVKQVITNAAREGARERHRRGARSAAVDK